MAYAEIETLAKALPHEEKMRLAQVLMTDVVWQNHHVFLEGEALSKAAEFYLPFDELDAVRRMEDLITARALGRD